MFPLFRCFHYSDVSVIQIPIVVLLDSRHMVLNPFLSDWVTSFMNAPLKNIFVNDVACLASKLFSTFRCWVPKSFVLRTTGACPPMIDGSSSPLNNSEKYGITLKMQILCFNENKTCFKHVSRLRDSNVPLTSRFRKSKRKRWKKLFLWTFI